MWVYRKFIRKRRKQMRTSPGRAAYIFYKESARKLIHDRVAYWSPKVGVKPGRIAVRDQRSRWGSCSTKGNLNFNYRLVLIPCELVDYVIVHELCHLIEFNHSERFWTQVRRVMPEYYLRKKALHAISVMSTNRNVPPSRVHFGSISV